MRLGRSRRLELTLAIATAGAAIALYLSRVALDPLRSVACGPVGDCHAVQSSGYAAVAGVPVAMLGLAMYLSLMALVALLRWPPHWLDPRQVALLVFGVSLAGAAYSGYLTYLELSVINAICAWCVASAIMIGTAFGLSIVEIRLAKSA